MPSTSMVWLAFGLGIVVGVCLWNFIIGLWLLGFPASRRRAREPQEPEP